MAGWTRVNTDEVRDTSPDGVAIAWRFLRDALGPSALGLSRFTYAPGARMPWGHRHRHQEELYVVVAGAGRAKLDDEVIDLATWDVLRVAPEVARSFEAGPDGMDLLCVGGPTPDRRDGEPVPDFWPAGGGPVSGS